MELLPLPVPIQSVEYRVSGVEKQGAHMRRQSSPEAQWQVQDSQSALPDTRHPAHDTLLSVPSVGLFVDRVQLVRLDFRLGRHNAEAVAALCARLEGIPLAIELAAARAHLLTPAQMLAQLEDRFAFLVSRNRDIPSRHRTLRATLEWSVRLLSPELQRFLARLSVFRGGWTLEAADSICAEVGRGVGGPHLPEKPAPDEEGKESRSSSLTLLEVLCNNSLVIAQETVEGGFRFRMLETVREFAAGLLEGSDEADQVRTRHGDWCVKLSTAGQRASSGPEQQIWMDRLELEHDNLRAALAWSLARAQNSENCEASPPLTALRLCVMLPYFWWTRGYFCEGRAWCDAVLDRIGRTALNHERGDVLLGVGVIAMRQGDYTAARAYFEESLAIRRALKHPRGISQVLNNLGMLACDEGDYEAAHAYYVESLSIKRELGDQQAVAGTLNNMGMVAQSRGDFIEAETLYQEALRINRESGNRAFEANNLNNLGLAAEFQGDLLRARAYYVESLPIRQAIGDRWGIAYSLYCLGHVDCLLDDYRSAEDYLQESLTIRKEIGHRPGIAQTLNALAELAAAFYWAGSTGTAISRPDDGDRKIAVVRDQFGPIAFDAAWSAGKGMSMDQAIAYAQSQSICL
jgi:predicted ATPase